ncbi:MAG TPA: glycosyltransferase family 4 protein [Candidatus Pristimantibacillus sp.]|nr:glycosyltransferase family 4 protein [Candidatus Pristimantibacillus sp.]
MKIGIVLPYAINRGGGVLEVARAQQAELMKRGHDTYIITPRPRDYEGEPDDHYIFVGGSTDFRALAQATTIQISSGLRHEIDDMLEREQFDILHFHEPWVPMLGAQILSRSQSVNIATFHANMPETVMARTAGMAAMPFAKSILKYLDALTATSDAAALYARNLTDKPIAIIPLGINQDLYQPPASFDDTHEPKTILYVGRLEGRKGAKYLLRALKFVQERHPDVQLKVCGDGPDRDKLERLVEDLELKNVSFLGYISTEDKVKYLQECDLYCTPAVYGEGFGIVLLEAMSTRTVIVAGDNPGYQGVMTGLGAISLINPLHSDDFARRLELLLYEPELRKLWREWATKELPKYRWSHMVDQYEEVYKQALAGSKDKWLD